MSKFKKKKTGDLPAISTASLPDIVFMLLFFFMVATVMRDSTLMVKNIIYSIWHIIAGFGLVYFIIPSAELWILILFTAGFASLREHIQKIRKTHKNLFLLKLNKNLLFKFSFRSSFFKSFRMLICFSFINTFFYYRRCFIN